MIAPGRIPSVPVMPLTRQHPPRDRLLEILAEVADSRTPGDDRAGRAASGGPGDAWVPTRDDVAADPAPDGVHDGVLRRRARAGTAAPAPLTIPPALREGRLAVDGRVLAAVLVLVVGVAVVLGVRVLRAQDAGTPVAASPGGVEQTGDRSGFTSTAGASASSAGAAEPSPGAAAPAGAPGATGEVVVDVVGRVRRPGVVRLPAGSRVADAVRRAGGVRQPARTSDVNMARPVVDGEQIRIPAPGERPSVPAPSGPGAPGAAPAGGAAGGAGQVNLNEADQSALEELPGVGPVTAEKILAWRTEHGRFTSVDELKEVSGIGEKTFAEIAPHVTV